MATSRRATPRRSGPAHRQAQTDAARRQAALLRLTTAIAAATDEREVYRSMVNGLHDEALGYNFLGAFLLDEASGDRVLQASVGWPDVPLDWHVHRGQGLSERALQDGQLHYTPDVTRAPGYLPSLASGSEVDVPLRVDGRTIGVLVVESSEPNAFGAEDFEILTAAANQASIAIGRARLLAEERRRVDEHKALLDTMADLSSDLELPRVLQAVLNRAVTLLGVTGGEVAIYEEQAKQLEVVASQNIGKDSTGTRLSLGEGAMGHVARTREPLIIPSYHEWLGRSGQYADVTVHSVMAAPLLIGRRLVGAIATVHSDPSRIFGAEDLRLLNMFAPQAAIDVPVDIMTVPVFNRGVAARMIMLGYNLTNDAPVPITVSITSRRGSIRTSLPNACSSHCSNVRSVRRMAARARRADAAAGSPCGRTAGPRSPGSGSRSSPALLHII